MNEEQVLELMIPDDVLSSIMDDFEKGHELLSEELENSTELESFLQNYMVDRWTIDNISITDLSFEENREEGHIEVLCGISQYNGCRDYNGEDEYQDIFSFKMDFENSVITITGNPIPDPRTTLDEF